MKSVNILNIQPNEWLKWMTSIENVNGLNEKHDKQADSCDDNVSPVTKAAADMLCKYLPDKDKTVLDVGTGTGLAGVALADLGFTTLVQLDLSATMLEKASSEKLPKAAGIIATDVFGKTQAGARALQVLQQHIEPNGILVFTVRKSFLSRLDSVIKNAPEWLFADCKIMGWCKDPTYLFAYRFFPASSNNWWCSTKIG